MAQASLFMSAVFTVCFYIYIEEINSQPNQLHRWEDVDFTSIQVGFE